MGISRLETGDLYCDDNFDLLPRLQPASVDLIYLDPPFFSNRDYEVIWGDEAEVRSFADRWQGGIESYLDWLQRRIDCLYPLLKPTGALYFHCGTTANAHIRRLLDKRFGLENFRNEIVWKRTGTHSSARRYGPVHETIFFYTKSRQYTWNPTYEDYNESYLQRYRYDDGDGRLYYPDNLTARGVRNGSSGQPWRGFDVAAKGNHWKFTIDRLDELDAEGRIYWPRRGEGWPRYKRYRDELKGRAISDVWTDIDPINAKAAERVGYPTQKPEALMTRIIRSSSDAGDLVLDPFCGCGTTIVAAAHLRRRWIGIDISPTALRVIRRRLDGEHIPYRIHNLPETEEALRELPPLEFQNWIIDAVNGTHSPRRVGDMGIDGYSFFDLLPIQVKQSERVGREVVDRFETAVRREGRHGGYIIAFSFGSGARKEAIRAKADGLQIELVKVSTLLDNPPDSPGEPDTRLPELTRLLLERAREARNKHTRREPPKVPAEDLIASARGVASH